MREQAQSYYADLAECLRERGFEVDHNPEDLGFKIPLASEQREAFEQAEAACRADAGEPPSPPGWTDEELTNLYEQSVEAYQCLVSEGYHPAEPPSLATFMSDYRSAGARLPYLPHMNPEAGPGSPNVRLMLPEDICPSPTLDP